MNGRHPLFREHRAYLRVAENLKLPSAGKHLLLTLWVEWGVRGHPETMELGNQYLASITSLSTRTVQRMARRLEAEGLVKRESGNRSKAPSYKLLSLADRLWPNDTRSDRGHSDAQTTFRRHDRRRNKGQGDAQSVPLHYKPTTLYSCPPTPQGGQYTHPQESRKNRERVRRETPRIEPIEPSQWEDAINRAKEEVLEQQQDEFLAEIRNLRPIGRRGSTLIVTTCNGPLLDPYWILIVATKMGLKDFQEEKDHDIEEINLNVKGQA